MTTVSMAVVQASVENGTSEIELDSHKDTCVVQDECLIQHDNSGPVHVNSYNPKDRHKSAKTVDAMFTYIADKNKLFLLTRQFK